MIRRLPLLYTLPQQLLRLTTSTRASHTSTHITHASPPSAALMVIGDEILAGSIADTNTPWLAKLLHSRGVDLIRVEYIPDDPEDIATTVRKLKERVGNDGFVFTSGGIGPTHDDKTYQSIACAFNLQLQVHQPTVNRMIEHYTARGIEMNDARMRMATLPTPCEVLTTPGLWVPLAVVAGNVHILPGIPKLFKAMIEANVERFKGPASKQIVLYSNAGEGDLADPLASIAAEFPNVRIGSYPNTQFDMNAPEQILSYRVKLVFEGRDAQAIGKAANAARAAIPDAKLDL